MMKKILFTIVLSAVIISLSSSASGQKAAISGKWKLDRSKTQITGEWPTLAFLTATIKGDSLIAERIYETGDGQQYPFTERISLDNKESAMTIYDMPRTIKGSWSDQNAALTFQSTTTFYGSSGAENFTSVETWKTDKTAGTLTISFINKTSGGEAGGTLFFNKQ